MIQKQPIILKPSWLVRFFARFIVLLPLLTWVLWVVRHFVAQPEMILHVSIEDWGMALIALLMLVCGLNMATIRVVLEGDAIEKRTIFGSKRLHLSGIGYRCHYYSRYVAIANLYAKDTPQRMFRPDMRLPIGLFSLSAGQAILQFIEPIPVSECCVYWRGTALGN
jgi:hypothetical protein